MILRAHPLLELIVASAYVVGLVAVARWLGGWLGPVVAVATPILALVLLGAAQAARNVEVRKR